jgi:hypothetical protein
VRRDVSREPQLTRLVAVESQRWRRVSTASRQLLPILLQRSTAYSRVMAIDLALDLQEEIGSQ